MFINTFRIEHSKLFKRSLPWVLIAVMAAIALLTTLLNYALLNTSMIAESSAQAAAMEQSLVWPQGLLGSIGLAGGSGLGGFIVVILVGAAVAQEYTWNTLQQWLGRGVPRPTFLAAKFAAFLLPIVLLVLTPLLVGGATTALFSLQLQGEVNVAAVDWVEVVRQVLLTAYSLLPYAGLTFLLAVVTRSTVAAVGGGVAYALLLEGVAMQMAGFFSETVARLSLYLPGGLARSLLESDAMVQVTMDGSPAAGPALLDPVVAATAVAVYTVIFLALSAWVLRRQDITGE